MEISTDAQTRPAADSSAKFRLRFRYLCLVDGLQFVSKLNPRPSRTQSFEQFTDVVVKRLYTGSGYAGKSRLKLLSGNWRKKKLIEFLFFFFSNFTDNDYWPINSNGKYFVLQNYFIRITQRKLQFTRI